MPYVTADKSLPRSLDVQITLSRPQAETRTDLSIMCVALEDLGFTPDSGRVRFYSTIEAVETDFIAGSAAHQAASAFFSQTPRAITMAIGEVYLSNLPAQLVSASLTAADIAAIKLITTGSMDITFDDGSGSATITATGMNFASVATIEDIVAVIDAALTASGLSASVKTIPGTGKTINITVDGAGGEDFSITFPEAAISGVFAGTALKLTDAIGGKALNGYTATNIADELASIQNAANNSGKYIYGWALGASLRDVAIQTAAAEWVQPRTGMMALLTNDVNALDADADDDLGSVLSAAGNRRAVPMYHDNSQRYPDVSILAYMLHVDYRLQDSTVTAKFKVLPGVETVQLTETQWSTLQGKGYNTYTAIGNDVRTYRDGVTSEAGWYMDTVINLDNFVEDLSVNVYNVFLRNKKVPYTRHGQMLLVDPCKDVGYQYTFNGTFADREELDTTVKSGVSITKAVQINPTPISLMSAADRAARSGPPIQMIVQEAGAIHSIAVNVEVVS